MVVGEVATAGKPATIVFFQLKEGRLRAGIFSINVKGDPNAAVGAFSRFRGPARQLARALQLSEVELMGAAVANKDVAAMLERLGFVKTMEPLPPSLGALPGEPIEVYAKRFPVQGPAVAGTTAAPAAAAEASTVGAGAAGRGAAAEASTLAAETATVAARASRSGALAVAGRVAGFVVRTIIFAVAMLGLEYLRARAEHRHFESCMNAAQPKIESTLVALEAQVQTLQRSAAGRTIWARVTIWMQSQHAVTGGMGMLAHDYSFLDAGFERASIGLDYLTERSSELGKPMSVPHRYGSTTFTPNRELVTYSVPIPYDPAALPDLTARNQRIRENERDAGRADLPQPVLQALFEEREAFLQFGPRVHGPPAPPANNNPFGPSE
jgi:hypothetical protein